MPESTQQLTFKLTIDGKEAIATLDVVKGEFTVTGEAAEKMNEELKKTYSSLISEALKYNTVNEANVQSLTEYITTQGLTIEQIQNSIYALDEETKALAINSDAWKSGMAASANLKAAIGGVITQQTGMTSAMHAGVPGVNQMRMAVNQFSYVLNDAQMFMVNARMGLMGISNNLPMIIQLMQQAKEAAKGQATMVELLTKSIMGGGGLIIGINALMLLINILPGLFDDTSDSARNSGLTLDELTKRTNYLTDGFANVKKEIQNLDFTELSEKYADLIQSINESESKLNKSSVWSQIWQGLTFKPLTEFLGYTFSWQDMLEGQDKDAADTLNKQQKAKEQIESIGLKIKEFLDSGYSAKSLLDFKPKDREFISSQLDDILNDWAENVTEKSIVIGDQLKGTFFELGRYSREEVEKVKKAIDDLNKPNKDAEKFTEARTKAVDDFIQKEAEQTEAARLYGLTYAELLTELENAEKDYAAVIDRLKSAENEKQLEAVQKFANYTKFRIDTIKDYVKEFLKANDEVDKELEEQAKEIEKYLIQLEEDRQKFEADQKKFFAELPAKIESDPFERQKKELDAEEQLTLKRAEKFGASEEMITNIKRYYENERLRIAEEAHFQELELLQNKINQIQSAYSQIFGIISANVRDEIDEWKKSEEQKLESERISALSHARNQTEKQRINELYEKRKEALEKEADKRAQARLETWFNLQKALAMAEIGINLAKAISVEWGKLGTLALFTQGFVIAALTSQLYAVSQQKFPKGFAEGGRLPAGRTGFIEGTHNELIAPEEDFKSIFNSYSADLVKRALVDYKNYVTINAGRSETEDVKRQLTKLEITVNKLNNLLEDGIDARAIYDEEAAEKIYLKGRGKYRRGKI